MKYLCFYLLAVNVVAVLVCIADKSYAKKGMWRVPERRLFLISVLGGGIGMYLTMKIIRHKTQHKRFMIGIPLIVIAELILLIFLSQCNFSGFFKVYY